MTSTASPFFRKFRLTALVAGLTGALAACSGSPTEQDTEPLIVRGLMATPDRPVFVCVTPGCDSTVRATVRVVGDRRVAVKRVILEGASKEDFSFEATQQAPFILGLDGTFDIDVRHTPLGAPAIEDSRLVISYTDASPEESNDRVPPGELEIPLVRRLVGEPYLAASPELLSFGVVVPGETATLPLTVQNEGFGNVALTVLGAESASPEFSVALPESRTLLPDSSFEVPVTFAPTTEAYTRTELTLTAAPENVIPARVVVEGTSLRVPRLAVEPGLTVELGEIPRGSTKAGKLVLVNQGGKPLSVTQLSVTGQGTSSNLAATPAGGPLPLALEPLQRATVNLELRGEVPGDVSGVVRLTSNSGQAPIDVTVHAVVTEPRLSASPNSGDFGVVPVGWVKTQNFELRNVGSGALSLKNIRLVTGSSALFSIRSLPGLPMELKPNETLPIEIDFRAETSAAFSGILSIESDGVENFVEIPLRATGGSCEQAFQIPNGTANCSSGVATIASCNPNWYDTDKDPANGCECRDVDNDPGDLCGSSAQKGSLKDDGSRTSHSGMLPIAGDVDLIRFHGQDAFGGNYHVRVTLDSSDPNIQMCVYRYDTGSPNAECYLSNEVCPDNRYYENQGGFWGWGNSSADYVVKVYRRGSSAPTCTSYTVHMSNG